ncbi:helix-turn-helix transcriptional regulator [Paenibacillus sp. UNC451MF]|uniref:helix-turn-helix transcriptional regulator n=1 Tax=Paenibacillus sp. UNC451MF TaxID=1449063 RepID=UPI0007E8B680|nr:YafY family protein [Paenibacillus sp. UNC451MF]
MPKSKRLIELMIAVNKRKKFTVRELAKEFNVSSRTIMRDLQELSELGVPLYSEFGPHGGYRVLNERWLPPITFSENEAVAMFFAYQSLQQYGALPFGKESASALNKFYHYLPEDTKDKIDKMKQRIVFWTPTRSIHSPHLELIMEASIQQQPLQINYDSKDGAKLRVIQPIGLYSYNGYWYSPAYCFTKATTLLFRVDRVIDAMFMENEQVSVDQSQITIMDWINRMEQPVNKNEKKLQVEVLLTKAGVRKCQWEALFRNELELFEDGTGKINMYISSDELDYFSSFFIGFGTEGRVVNPKEMVEMMQRKTMELAKMYSREDNLQGTYQSSTLENK